MSMNPSTAVQAYPGIIARPAGDVNCNTAAFARWMNGWVDDWMDGRRVDDSYVPLHPCLLLFAPLRLCVKPMSSPPVIARKLYIRFGFERESRKKHRFVTVRRSYRSFPSYATGATSPLVGSGDRRQGTGKRRPGRAGAVCCCRIYWQAYVCLRITGRGEDVKSNRSYGFQGSIRNRINNCLSLI
jgi:hypothetical protein